MRDLEKIIRPLGHAVLAVAVLLALACSADSPTRPQQNPQQPDDSGTTWNITVTADQTQIEAGSGNTAIRIQIRNAATGAAPPSGATATVSTTLGEFNSAGSGVQSLIVNLVNGDAVLQFFGGSTTGVATIVARLESSTGSVQVQISGSAVFFLDKVVPSFGDPAGGETVEILGGGFKAPVRVTFGGAVAEVISVTSSTITVRTPPADVAPGESLTVDVAVTNLLNSEGQQLDTLTGGFTYSAGDLTAPAIFSITPNSGPNEGGTRVVINGDGFEAPVQVLFGQGNDTQTFSGIEATVQSVNRTQIVVLTPAATAFGQNNLNQVVSVLVRNQESGLAAVAQAAFQYGVQVLITAISPSQGPYFGGQLVTLFGQGFDEPVAVSLAGVGQQIVSVTGTEIVVRTSAIRVSSCEDSEGPASVTNIETGNGDDDGPIYIYEVVVHTPSVFSVNPNSGTITGGTLVTIRGSGFAAPIQVFFGDDRPANIISLTPDEIVVEAPFFPERSLDTEACDDNSDGTPGERFIPTSVDIFITSLATTCEATFTEGYFYEPTDNTCRNDVGEPPEPPEPPDPPVANFEWELVPGSSPPRVLFNSTSTGLITSHTWNFDGLGTGTGPAPTFTFPGPGSYVVTLTVFGPGGSDAFADIVTIP